MKTKDSDIVCFFLGILGGMFGGFMGAHYSEQVIKFIGELCEKI